MLLDTAYEIATSNIRFGPGTTKEIGMDLKDLGLKRVMVLTDPNLREQAPVQTALAAIAEAGVEYALFDQVRVEPTDASFKAAIAYAEQGFDGFVAVGGGSVMDTAKAANVYTTYPADFLTYVNAPIGRGEPVPGPLKPLIAVPTTAGTGSETTGVAIFDFVEMKAKTGMAHRYMRPTLGIVDPDNTRSMPPQVAAATGLDVLSHALESYTALPFDQRPRPDRPPTATSLPRLESHQRLVGVGGFAVGGAISAPRRGRPKRRRIPQCNELGRGPRRHWLWQRRRPLAARHVLSGGWHGGKLCARRIRHRLPAGTARVCRDCQLACGLPLHRTDLPPAASAGGRSLRGRLQRGERRGRRPDLGRPHRLADAPTRRTQRPQRTRLRPSAYPGASRGHATAAPGDQAFAASG